MLSIFISLLIAITLGSGVAISANRTKPGDVLYPFKVGVTERVEEALAKDSEAKLALHMRAMDERLEEATELAARGILDKETAARLMANFTMHAQAVTGTVARLQTSGDPAAAAELATRFQATLTQQTATLTDLSAKSTTPTQTSLATVLGGVQQALGAAAAVSIKASAQAAVE